MTLPQMRTLVNRVQAMERPKEERDLTCEDLMILGYGRNAAERILDLLSQDDRLAWYVGKGGSVGCYPVTRVSQAYPHCLRQALRMDAPGTLWIKGDPALLATPGISLVGSRDLHAENYAFAKEVGKQAALQGYTLISGNARGADRTAQDACLDHGGKVISVVADELQRHTPSANILYVSEVGYDQPFSAQRALQRNRIIHAWGEKVFVAQCNYRKGGTWSGTTLNLHHRWRPVFCFADGSLAAEELQQRGAAPIRIEALSDISALCPSEITFFDP